MKHYVTVKENEYYIEIPEVKSLWYFFKHATLIVGFLLFFAIVIAIPAWPILFQPTIISILPSCAYTLSFFMIGFIGYTMVTQWTDLYNRLWMRWDEQQELKSPILLWRWGYYWYSNGKKSRKYLTKKAAYGHIN